LLLTGHKDLAPPLQTLKELDIQGYCEKSNNFDQLLLLIESGLKSVDQMHLITKINEELKDKNDELEKAYLDTIGILRYTVEAKDQYTSGHSDGKGYPKGLAGNDIPLTARIAAVADTYDAMTSKRTYRDALPLEVVTAEIEKCSGTQFDPEIAKVFLSILSNDYKSIEEIQANYR